MPRPQSALPAVFTNSVIASGARMAPARVTSMQSTHQTWQDMAWHFFDTVGELQYAATWFGSALSRARLYVAKRDGREFETQESGPAVDTLESFFAGPEGQAQAMSSIGVHLFIVGECYIVGRKPRSNRGEKFAYLWEVVGINEMRKLGATWTIEYDDGKPNVVLDDSEDIIRIWLPHPKKRNWANSPVKAVLSALAEIEYATSHIKSQLISRLTGNGILLLPQGLTFPSPIDGSLPENASEADKVMQILFDSMNHAITHPGEASAQTPIVLMVPEQFVDKANLLKFWSELDAKIIEMRNDAIKRTAQGLNIPVEVLTGTADVNHWGAWQIDESSIKSHIEPMLEVMVAAFTTQLIFPATGDAADVVRYDTSALRLRPNRSKEAIELYDRGELKAETLLRETGFGAEDMPDDEERKRWLLVKMASGSASPEQVDAAMRLLGVDLPPLQQPEEQTRESRPDPSLLEHPTRDLPEPDLAAAVEIGIVRAAEGVALRALERAGNRLRSSTTQRPACTATEVHTFIPVKPTDLDRLLDGAWDHIPQVMRGIPFDQQQALQAGLDAYCRAVLVGQKEHDIDLMKRHLTMGSVRRLA